MFGSSALGIFHFIVSSQRQHEPASPSRSLSSIQHPSCQLPGFSQTLAPEESTAEHQGEGLGMVLGEFFEVTDRFKNLPGVAVGA